MSKKNIAEKLVAKAAYEASKNSVNQACQWFFHQPKLPEAVKKLRKF